MSLIKWRPKHKDPFEDFFESTFPFGGLSLLPGWEASNLQEGVRLPAVDIKEDKHNIYVHADIPGVDKNDIQVNVEDSVLTIRAERKRENKKQEEDYTCVERAYGVFERRINLGTNVNREKITAKYNNGVLDITLPRTKEADKKNIAIE